MKALVLGGTGFIGGQIIRAALAAGYQVCALRRRHTVGALADIGHRVDWIWGDVDNANTVAEAAVGCDVLFHAAAFYPHNARDFSSQVDYARRQMKNVLDAAQQAGVERLIYTSSLTTVGRPSQPGRLADERDFYVRGASDSVYYEAKFAMEQLSLEAAANGIPTVTLLPTAVFGPGDVKPTTGQLLVEVAKGRVPLYFDATINVVDVRDVAAAHIAAVERGCVGERYIIGGHNLTLRQGLTSAARAAGVRPPRIKLPLALVRAIIHLASALPGVAVPENARTFHLWQPLSTRKAEQELGLSARPFEQTAADTIAWFRTHGYL